LTARDSSTSASSCAAASKVRYRKPSAPKAEGARRRLEFLARAAFGGYPEIRSSVLSSGVATSPAPYAGRVEQPAHPSACQARLIHPTGTSLSDNGSYATACTGPAGCCGWPDGRACTGPAGCCGRPDGRACAGPIGCSGWPDGCACTGPIGCAGWPDGRACTGPTGCAGWPDGRACTGPAACCGPDGCKGPGAGGPDGCTGPGPCGPRGCGGAPNTGCARNAITTSVTPQTRRNPRGLFHPIIPDLPGPLARVANT